MRFLCLLFGLFGGLVYGLLLLVADLQTRPFHRVTACKLVSRADGKWVHLWFEDKSEYSLDIWVLDENCLAPGTTIEKRRGEVGYRLNGAEPKILDGHLWGAPWLFAFCCATAVIAFGYGLIHRE